MHRGYKAHDGKGKAHATSTYSTLTNNQLEQT